MSSPKRVALLAASLLAVAIAGACSLNPQPIPPGFDTDAGFGTAGGSDASRGGADTDDGEAVPAPANDAATAGDGFATPKSDAGDAGNVDASDGGQAGDSGDASAYDDASATGG